MRKETRQRLNKKSYLRKVSRNHARNIRGDTPCFACGTDENVTIHHEDGDITNNSLGNLVALCRKCHDKEHGIVTKQFN